MYVTASSATVLQVFATNTNTLAKWIYNEQITTDRCSDSAPLELAGLQAVTAMIEIGLEKLTKDYIHAFVGKIHNKMASRCVCV